MASFAEQRLAALRRALNGATGYDRIEVLLRQARGRGGRMMPDLSERKLCECGALLGCGLFVCLSPRGFR